MRVRRPNESLRLVAAMVLGVLLAVPLTDSALAQQAPASAELKRVIGRVEVLRKGQTQWIPAVIGARLVEGDDIRAFSGAQAELALPDTSTVQLAENSRLLLTKLEYDQQNQSRIVLLHLVVGKVRAHGGRVLVFGHGHASRALAARWLAQPVDEGRLFRLDTATVSVLGYEHELPVVARWNG